MSLTWQSWASVSQGSTLPGAPVTAVPWGKTFALFLSDPNGGIYGIKAMPGYGWEAVPGRFSKPGAQITALATGDRFTLFMADANGEVVMTRGAPYQGWAGWTSVSQGSTLPGAPVAAVPWGESFALFLSDPNGGIYAIKAVPGYGWEAVPGRLSKPGAHITALATGDHFTLFMADATGEVFKNTGAPYQGWAGWTSVSQGSTLPGAPVAAVPWGESFALFLSDPNGGIYAIKAVPGYGWEAVPGRLSKPGAHITALSWFRPPLSGFDVGYANIPILLFMTDTNGEIVTTWGLPYQDWQSWASVSGGVSVPGAAVGAASEFSVFAPFSLFATNAQGEVRSATSGAPPAVPDLAVTGVTQQTIGLSWSETNPPSVQLTGFALAATKMVGNQDAGTVTYIRSPADRSATFSELDSGTEYRLRLTAFSDDGYSSPEAAVMATTLQPQETASLTAVVALGSDPQNPGVYSLVINGHNFLSGEDVLLTIMWTEGGGTGIYEELVQALNGTFSLPFNGNTPYGLCAGSSPYTGQQIFQVQAVGQSSHRQASASTLFSCP